MQADRPEGAATGGFCKSLKGLGMWEHFHAGWVRSLTPRGGVDVVLAVASGECNMNHYKKLMKIIGIATLMVLPVAGKLSGAEYWIAPDGHDGAAGTPQAPLKTIEAAVARCGSGTNEIVFMAGVYNLTNEVTLVSAITVRSENRDPESVTLHAAAKSRHFTLNHVAATLEGLSLADGKPAAGNGGCVLIKPAGGTIRKSVMRGGQTQAWGTQGGGFFIEKNAATALVEHCIVTNCCCATSGNGVDQEFGGGLGATVSAGEVRNCLFAKNRSTSAVQNKGGTVFITGGRLVNCTIAGNLYGSCPGVRANAGEVVNCLIGGNVSTGESTGHDYIWLTDASCFTNCLSDQAINGSCFASLKLFVNVAEGNWRPATAAVDCGVRLDWMDAPATDLAGQSRVSGTEPDIGCYELNQNVFSACAVPSATRGFAPLNITFTVTAYGVGAQGVACEWDWNGDGVYDETTAGTTSHLFSSNGDFAVGLKVTDTATGTFQVDSAAARISVRPKVMFVDSDSDAPVFPYDDPAHAAKNVAEAVAAAISGCTVEIATGTYDIPAQIELVDGVTLRGATGDPADVVFRMVGTNHRVVYLAHPDARIENLVVQGGNIQNNTTLLTKNGGGIFIGALGGTVSNCIVRACRTWIWGNEGDGIFIAAGADAALVTHSVISNCVSDTSSGSDSGNAVTMYGGQVRNCLIAYNVVTPNSTSLTHPYGTVKIGGGTLANCTIVKNKSFNCSGVYATAGHVVNCTIGLNTSDFKSGDANYVVWAGTASCFSNCIASLAINGWCLAESATDTFTDPDHGDFSLPAVSSAVDAGVLFDWMQGATDFAGNSRIRGDQPDIGAFEADASLFCATFQSDVTEGFAPLAAGFTVTPANAAGVVSCRWDWDGDGVYDETIASVSATHTFATCGTYPVRLEVSDGVQTFTVPAAVSVKAAPRVLYAAPDCAGSAAPYESPVTAATNLQDAIDYAIDGCEIRLAAGIYPVNGHVAVVKAVAIRGASGNPEDTVLKNVKVPRGADMCCRVLYVNHAGARVSGVVVTDGLIKMNSVTMTRNGAGIFLGSNGGIVSNCVIRNCSTWIWGNLGGGVYIDAGAAAALLTHCFVTNCQADAESNQSNLGAAVYMAAGTVRDCLLAYNDPPSSKDGTTAVLWTAYVAGGRMVNCTVVANDSAGPSGVYCTGGEVVNCAISGNSTRNSNASTAFWGGSASTFRNCLTDGAAKINSSCMIESKDATFKAFARGRFALQAKSIACNAGLSGYDDSGSDLAAGDRLFGRGIDIGCYECQHGAGAMLIMR